MGMTAQIVESRSVTFWLKLEFVSLTVFSKLSGFCGTYFLVLHQKALICARPHLSEFEIVGLGVTAFAEGPEEPLAG